MQMSVLIWLEVNESRGSADFKWFNIVARLSYRRAGRAGCRRLEKDHFLLSHILSLCVWTALKVGKMIQAVT